MQELPAWLRFN